MQWEFTRYQYYGSWNRHLVSRTRDLFSCSSINTRHKII